MRLVCRKEEEDLLGWEDPGEAPQHKTEGYMPMVDEEAVPWINPREQGVKTLRGREAEEKNAAKNFERLIREDALPNRDVLPHQRSTNGARV